MYLLGVPDITPEGAKQPAPYPGPLGTELGRQGGTTMALIHVPLQPRLLQPQTERGKWALSEDKNVVWHLF